MKKRHYAMFLAVVAAAIGGLLLVSGNPDKPEPPRSMRIVSLAPSVTEMLFALGLGDCVVAATDYCNYPPAARELPRIGGFGRPNMEKLLTLAPDLVVSAGLERGDTANAVRSSGLKLVELQMRNFDELFAAFIRIGQAAGRSEQAQKLVASMRAQLDAVSADAAPPGSQPRVFVELWADPLSTAGGPSFLNDLIARAGGVNVAAGLDQPHPKINPEQVIAWDPDVIVVCHMGRDATPQTVAARIGWADIAAVRNNRVFADIPADLLLRPGPRLIDGVKLLHDRMYQNPPSPPGRGVRGEGQSDQCSPSSLLFREPAATQANDQSDQHHLPSPPGRGVRGEGQSDKGKCKLQNAQRKLQNGERPACSVSHFAFCNSLLPL